MRNTNRNWMYERLDERGHISPFFINGVNTFIDFAYSKKSYMDGDKIRCPCTKCHNKAYKSVDKAKFHLYKFGFVPNYDFWDKHGETSTDRTPLEVDDTHTNVNEPHEPTYTDMVLDAAGPDFVNRNIEEEPNVEDKKFFDMLEAADKELWSGCKKVTQLSVVARLLNIKSEYRIPEQCFDTICQLIKDGLPEENNMVDGLYDSKKLIQALGLPVELIDSCRSGCMLYWKGDKDLDRCKYIHDLSRRPLRTVKSYNVYFVNGYKFHTQSHGANKSTMNSGLCISSPLGDYYGKLLEILEIEYPGLPIKRTVLFKCHWYDPTPNVGVKVHNQYKLVDINHRKTFNRFEPFILAMQASQVCFMPYPSLKQNNSDWLAVCKVKPRGWIEVRKSDHQKDDAFQEDEVEANEIISTMAENVDYDDLSSNESDNENNNEHPGEFENDDVSNDDTDGDAESEAEFEYSTSTNDEEDHCDDSD